MSGESVVISDRKWFGDPRGSPQLGSGMYEVLLDGRRAGVTGGSHRVRVRQGLGSSPTLEVRVADGEAAVLQADMADRDRSFLYRMATYMFHSGRFLSLRIVPDREPEAGE